MLMSSDLMKLVEAIRLGKATVAKISQNITIAIVSKALPTLCFARPQLKASGADVACPAASSLSLSPRSAATRTSRWPSQVLPSLQRSTCMCLRRSDGVLGSGCRGHAGRDAQRSIAARVDGGDGAGVCARGEAQSERAGQRREAPSTARARPCVVSSRQHVRRPRWLFGCRVFELWGLWC